jgi:hypothetical protein
MLSQSLGFEVSEKHKKSLKEQFRQDINDIYRHRNRRAAIWGVASDRYDSPFDIIDRPPSYGQIAKDLD